MKWGKIGIYIFASVVLFFNMIASFLFTWAYTYNMEIRIIREGYTLKHTLYSVANLTWIDAGGIGFISFLIEFFTLIVLFVVIIVMIWIINTVNGKEKWKSLLETIIYFLFIVVIIITLNILLLLFSHYFTVI